MSRELSVAQLAADLSAHLAEVKNGESLTIYEDGKAIAEITPPPVVSRGTRYPFRDFEFGKRPTNLKSDPAELIIEEREYERSGKKFGV